MIVYLARELKLVWNISYWLLSVWETPYTMLVHFKSKALLFNSSGTAIYMLKQSLYRHKIYI